MKKLIGIAVIIAMLASYLEAKDVVVIGHIMYQNQPFSKKDKQIFDADREGSRVWSLGKAVKYCENLKLSGYDDWRVASKKELQAIMTRKPSRNGMFVKSVFAMPATGGKYDNVWMWTRVGKTPNLGEYVNFKKAKSGWASDKYKGYVICTRRVKKATKKISHKSPKKVTCKCDGRQELTYSRDWVKVWNTRFGYTALKKDGTLWQFGKVGGSGCSGITPIDPRSRKKKVYKLQPKKIGSGFKGAKIINGGYRLYAIKRDGTLWGWGEGFGAKPLRLSKSHKWSDFGIKNEGNACSNYDVGLKKDGTLWRFPEFVFARDKYKTPPILKKISRFSDWKKIVLGCEIIYGVRKNGSLWKSNDIDDKGIFKRYKPKKQTYDADSELYPWLKSKMAKVPSGTIYNPDDFPKKMKIQKDGTLCLPPVDCTD